MTPIYRKKLKLSWNTIRKATAQIDRYGFLDYDDVNAFNGYLYQEKRTSREKEKMESFLDKALRLIYKHPVEVRVKDILMKDERLAASAKTNTFTDFHFTYNDSVDDALVDGYDQNEEFYSPLLNNDELKKTVMHVFIEDVYKSLKGTNTQ
jgi:hypothetical protein